MAYEIVTAIRGFIEQGIGDTDRLQYILNRLEKGEDLYFSDKKYLENLFYENEPVTKQTEQVTESRSLAKLENDLKNLNARLENILKNQLKEEKIKSNSNLSAIQRSKLVTKNTTRQKNEQVALVLAVVLGLVTLQGIGHIYVGKIARGAAILSLSLLLGILFISSVAGIMPKDSILSSVSILPIFIAGYLGLYIFQVLDSRKLCMRYNQYTGQDPIFYRQDKSRLEQIQRYRNVISFITVIHLCFAVPFLYIFNLNGALLQNLQISSFEATMITNWFFFMLALVLVMWAAYGVAYLAINRKESETRQHETKLSAEM